MMSVDKSVKSSSNSNPSIKIENKAGSGSQDAPLMIASGNVYLRLAFLFMLGLFGFLVWSHVTLLETLQNQTKAIVSIAFTVGQHDNLIKHMERTR